MQSTIIQNAVSGERFVPESFSIPIHVSLKIIFACYVFLDKKYLLTYEQTCINIWHSKHIPRKVIAVARGKSYRST